MSTTAKVRLLKVALWLGALTPLAWCIAGYFRGWLGANPIQKLEHVTGMAALLTLLATLSVTPLRRLTGWNPLIRLRRPMGLFAFFYVFLHVGVWAGLDETLMWSWMGQAIAKRPYITAGFIGFVLLIPLALTSTKASMRRLGKWWTAIHRLVYVAAALGILHYYWSVKSDVRVPVLLGVIYVGLMLLRLPAWLEKRARRRELRTPGSTADAAEGSGRVPDPA